MKRLLTSLCVDYQGQDTIDALSEGVMDMMTDVLEQYPITSNAQRFGRLVLGISSLRADADYAEQAWLVWLLTRAANLQ